MKKRQVPKPLQPKTKSPPIPIIIKSARKSEAVGEGLIRKQPASPLMGLDVSEEDLSSHEKEEFLLLQIKQVKRQNNFLRKKLSQLTAEFGPQRPKKPKQKGAGVANLQIMPLSINLFFEEIHNLLGTIVKLFRIQFTPEEVALHQQQFGEEVAEACPIKRSAILKKFYLKRKLQRMMLENEEQRFPHFLQLFTEYYQFKEESDAKIIEAVDRMTLRAHDLNEIVLRKAQQRKSTRSTYSMIRPEDQPPLLETLNVPISPKNHVLNNKLATYSPANRKKKPTKFTMSPADRNTPKNTQ